MKIIVFGPSFCGSTVFSGAMQNIPDLCCIGEAHWVIDSHAKYSDYAQCSIHGFDCDFVKPIVMNPPPEAQLYDYILKKSGKKHLLTTDKSNMFVQRFCKPKTMMGIVLFKSPEAMVASGRRHPVGWENQHGSIMNLYHKFYDHTLSYVQSSCTKWCAVESEIFARNPADEVRAVADYFGLDQPKSFQFPHPDWHNIGGNPAYKNKHFNYKIKPDLRWKNELSDQDKEKVRQHKESRQMWRRLQHRCISH
jgi:hypothetical protein